MRASACWTLQSTCDIQSRTEEGQSITRMLLAFVRCQNAVENFDSYSHRGSATGSRAGSDLDRRCAFAVVMDQHRGVRMDVTVALWST